MLIFDSITGTFASLIVVSSCTCFCSCSCSCSIERFSSVTSSICIADFFDFRAILTPLPHQKSSSKRLLCKQLNDAILTQIRNFFQRFDCLKVFFVSVKDIDKPKTKPLFHEGKTDTLIERSNLRSERFLSLVVCLHPKN